MWVNWGFYKKKNNMLLRDYEGWKRYSKWKRETYKTWEDSIKKQPLTNNPEIKNIDQMPDQKWHRIISFIKSGIRIVGYAFIPFNLITATALLVISEVVGIIEELV